MKKNETINHERFGTGTVVSIKDGRAKVDFNGEVKTIIISYFKPVNEEKRLKKIATKNAEPKITVSTIKSWIQGDREMRGSTFSMLPIWSEIMQKSDEVGSFVSEIIESALNGGFVSEKQAWAVAYFAKNNGLLK